MHWYCDTIHITEEENTKYKINTNMKQINKRAAFYAVCGIVMAGSFCQYLYNALDDYGLRTNTLNGMIKAQADETATHDYSAGSCDNVMILCKHFLRLETTHEGVVADDKGTLNTASSSMSGYLPKTKYWVTTVRRVCKESDLEMNICNREREGIISMNATKASSTSDDTSGDATNRP